MNKISSEILEKVKEAVHRYPDLWSNQMDGYVAAYLLLNRKTGEVNFNHVQKGTGCHYGFSLITDDHIAVNGHLPTHHGSHPEFTKWVCRESPFAHGVINRNNEDEILNHAAAFDGFTIGQGGCLWLGKALRYTVEDKFRIPHWYKFREEGLNGLQAFIGCSILDSAGNPQAYHTHNSLISYGPPKNLRKIYDELKNIRKIENSQAARSGGGGLSWGNLKGRLEKRSDGWGGFTEVVVPGDAKDFAKLLKEIFEGDPNNVK